MSETTLLSVQGLTKAYPGVVANDDVSFAIRPGEIHALLGENGAGKSTLVKMLYGLVRPDEGRMDLHGRPYAPASPQEARTSGVAMVFQHFSLFEALDVAENVALGMASPPPRRQLARRIREVSEEYGLPLDPARLVGELSAGERQRVEIVRCLLQDPRLLIMDEPTSVLTPQEANILFRTLRTLASEGTAILYISHKLEEIRALCDAATILRLGRVVGRCDPRQSSAAELAEMMVGGSLHVPTRAAAAPGDVVLELSGLSVPSTSPFGTSLKDVTLTVRAGEVAGRRRCRRQRPGRASGGAFGRGPHDAGRGALRGARHRPSGSGRAPPSGPAGRPGGASRPRRRPRHDTDRERDPDRRGARRADAVRLRALGCRARLRPPRDRGV